MTVATSDAFSEVEELDQRLRLLDVYKDSEVTTGLRWAGCVIVDHLSLLCV